MNKPIIIIGSGKSALLHLNAYIKIWADREFPQIYIAPGDTIESEITDVVNTHTANIKFTTPAELPELCRDNPVADICTPTATHRAAIETMLRTGFQCFLVEKPLVTTAEDFKWLASQKIRIEVMQNYLFSLATRRVLQLIQDHSIIPENAASFFCKDRTQDSLNKRGFYNGQPPHVFTVELPHQLYLAEAFLGRAKINAAHAEDMLACGTVFTEHGTGIIYLNHGDSESCTSSVNFSCLSSHKTIKKFIINATNGNILTINYPVSKSNLTSTIEVNGIGGAKREAFENDDMITAALKHYYDALNSNIGSNSFGSTGILIEAMAHEQGACL